MNKRLLIALLLCSNFALAVDNKQITAPTNTGNISTLPQTAAGNSCGIATNNFKSAKLDINKPIARRGCCSHHGGVCGCSNGRAVCCDGRLSPSCGCD